jgi:hypothetical protein
MRGVLQTTLVALAGILVSGTASADVFSFDTQNTADLCNGSCGTVTVTFNSGIIHFDINVAPYTLFGKGNGAFGFNVVGDNDADVQISNIVNGALYGFSGKDGNVSGFGTYEFLIDGPPASKGAGTLSFDVSRPADPFTGLSDVYQASVGGKSAPGGGYFVAHVRNAMSRTAVTGFAQTGGGPAPIPEPASILLLGTIAGGLSLLRRRRTA